MLMIPTTQLLDPKTSAEVLRISSKQIMESRGYDVDYVLPNIANFPLHRVDVDLLEKRKPKYYQIVMDTMKFAFAEINAHAEISIYIYIYIYKFYVFFCCFGKVGWNLQMNGEKYELLDLKRLVEALANRMSLITFSVKQVAPNVDVVTSIQAMGFSEFGAGGAKYQLIEWRFKPEASSREMESSEARLRQVEDEFPVKGQKA